eukprot:7564904-Prorocentrum_lima.AAC.1
MVRLLRGVFRHHIQPRGEALGNQYPIQLFQTSRHMVLVGRGGCKVLRPSRLEEGVGHEVGEGQRDLAVVE